MTHVCKSCVHWSELVWCYEEGELRALCEAPEGSPLSGEFSSELDSCSAWVFKPTLEE